MSDDPSFAPSTLSPDISYKPPAVYSAFFLFGLLVNLMWPIEILNFWAQTAIGLIGIGMGGGLVAWAIRTLRAAGTTFKLGAPVSAFVRHGPYRFSRNPIYLGLSFIYISLCTLFDAPIAALLIVPLTMVMNRFVIAREETFLAARFGADYQRYKDVVSRWM
jgi:protein-S-isoprenylcysteine O-methyltransferase Ste14